MSKPSKRQCSRSRAQRGQITRGQIMRATTRLLRQWSFPLGVTVAALLVAFGVASAMATGAQASGSGGLKQQAATMQAQWMSSHAQHPGAKAHLKPGQWASCAMPLNQAPIVVTNVQGPGGQYNSYINVISTNKRPYAVLGEMGKIVVIERQVDMCDPNDTPTAPRAYVLPGQPGQVSVTAVRGDVVTFTTATGASGQFNYVTGVFL